MEGNNGRLLLTLCKSDAKGSYHHAMIPLPRSYEAAVTDARQIFQPYVGKLRFQASDIVLKCAIKRANGTAAWGILRPSDWSSVIRPDGDEVGVFIRQDSLDLPYEPMESGKAKKVINWQGHGPAQQPKYDHPAQTSGIQMERKIMYLTLKNGTMVVGNEKSTMIKVPATYQECQLEAYNAFRTDLGYDVKQSDVVLESKRGERRYGSLDSWSIVTPAVYELLVSESSGRIDLWVSGPPKPAWSYD